MQDEIPQVVAAMPMRFATATCAFYELICFPELMFFRLFHDHPEE